MRDIAEHVQRLWVQGMTLYWFRGRGKVPAAQYGLRCLFLKRGLFAALLVGGAIEGHAIAEARTMVGKDVCRVENLALRPQAENSIGMVCGGDAVLLYAPICAESEAWAQVSSQLLKCFEQRTPAYLVGMPRWWLAVQSSVALFGSQRRTCGGVQLAEQKASASKKRVIDGFFAMPVSIPVRAINV